MKRATSKPVILPRDFYNRSPDVVARALLGKILLHRRNGERLTGRIIETEAYLGLSDPASHAFIGRTSHNAVLFGPPGFVYVYLIYGLHNCLNVSCLPDGEPGGLLFRALVPIEGLATMAKLRHLPEGASAKSLTGGPGRLCEALDITRATHNNLDVTSSKSILQILDDGQRPDIIEATPRIGISKAIDLPLRFVTTWKQVATHDKSALKPVK